MKERWLVTWIENDEEGTPKEESIVILARTPEEFMQVLDQLMDKVGPRLLIEALGVTH